MCDVYMMYKYDVISNGKIKKGKCQLGDAKKKYDYSSYRSKNFKDKHLNEINIVMIQKIRQKYQAPHKVYHRTNIPC